MTNLNPATRDTEKLTIMAVGDIAPFRHDPESLFAPSADVLKKADLTLGQLEVPLSDKGTPQEIGTRVGEHGRANPKNVSALTFAGINVISYTANHGLDYGPEAFLDTIDILRKNNITVIGVGNTLAEARKPVMIEKKGTRIAFLAYSSVPSIVPPPDKPNIALVRASTTYQQVDPQPGYPPNIVTTPNKEDLDALVSEIKAVRPQVDVIIVSMHWGVHFIPFEIPDYEWEVGHAIIDAGADLVLGGHPHVLKAIETYNGKVIFHSLANFAGEIPQKHWAAFRAKHDSKRRKVSLPPKHHWDPEYPSYPFHPESRKTIIAKVVISDRKIQKVSFLPCLVNKSGATDILRHGDKEFSGVIDYLREAGDQVTVDTKFKVEGDEVVVLT